MRSSDSLEEEEVHRKTFKKLNLEAHTNSLDGTKITQRKSALKQEKHSVKYDVKVAITKFNSLVDVTIKKRAIQGRIQSSQHGQSVHKALTPVAEVPPQRLRRMVIRRGRCMTWGRFVDHVTQELVSAASPMVAMIDGMMSFVHDVRCWR